MAHASKNVQMEEFGKYQLERRLAYGGMAEIFLGDLCLEEDFRKKVVIKRILPQFSADGAFVQMFIYEAVLAARFNHPHVVQIYDFGQIDGAYFIAMEYVEGCDLRELLKAYAKTGERLCASEVAYLGELCADALAYVHAFKDDRGQALRIVHRDISPANLMLSAQGQLKIMDFGIARCAARKALTSSGVVKGKLAYLSPEQARAEPLDGRSDQFALGLVLLECLAGEKVYQAQSEAEMLALALAGEITLPLYDVDSAAGQLLAILTRTLQPEAQDRYENCSELAEALRCFRLRQDGGADVKVEALMRRKGVEEETLERDTANPWATTPLVQDQTAATEISAKVQSTNNLLTSTPAKKKGLLWASLIGALALLGLGGVWWQNEKPQVTMPVSEVHFESVPAGVEIFVDGVAMQVRTPGVLMLPLSSVKRLVEFRRDGFVSHTRWSSFDTAKMHLSVTLEALKPALAKPQNAVPKKNSMKKTSLVDTPQGFLSLRTQGGWAEVYFKGKRLGITPLKKVALPAGKIELDLINPVAGVKRHLVLELEEGQHTLHSEKIL